MKPLNGWGIYLDSVVLVWYSGVNVYSLLDLG